MRDNFRTAILNIQTYGDTDIFPYPIESHIFSDQPDKSVALLESIHSDFDKFLAQHPPINESTLSPVGHNGFRWATQIDPIWNAYILGLIISIGPLIEKARPAVQKARVFSFRFNETPSDHSIFHKDIGWKEFQLRSRELAANYKYVLICDIADFYGRIYHHRLENALAVAAKAPPDIIDRIKKFLQSCSRNNSYGLPVGGPGSRLLAELLLSRVDRLLTNHGIEFCRFADDYHIFAKSTDEAYNSLIFLAEKLMVNEGLALQKAKTRILSTSEFQSTSIVNLSESEDESGNEAAEFLSTIDLRFDPYSSTPQEDYKKIATQVQRFNIVNMLSREMAKSRVHEALTRKLIKALKYLQLSERERAVRSLIENAQKLAPVLPTVLILVREVLDDLSESTQDHICQQLQLLIQHSASVMELPLNLSYALRVIARRHTDESEALLAQLFRTSTDIMVRRDIILIMRDWNATHWLSDIKNNFEGLGHWERRAFVISSYALGDEGSHWRNKAKHSLTPIELLFRDWASDRINRGKTGRIL